MVLKGLRLTTASVISLVVAGSLALSGCGSSASQEPTPSASVPSAAQPSASQPASAAPSQSAAPSSSAKALTSLDQVTVTGDYGKAPKIQASWPFTAAKTESKVLKQGTGPTVPKGGLVTVNYAGINMTTGQEFDSSFKRGQSATFPLEGGVIAGFRKGLEGQKVGSRVLVVMTPADGYPQGSQDGSIPPGTSLLFVVDVLDTQLDGPTGTPVAPAAGLPTVKDNGKGKAPTISVQGASKDAKLRAQPLIQGNGKVVGEKDGVVLNYAAYRLSDGKLVVQNYTTGAEQGQLPQLIQGFRKTLVKQKVGSRMLLIVPPADAYPKGNATPSIPAGEPLVYVVDILFAGSLQ